MADFSSGAYVGVRGIIFNADGTTDEQNRWVDDRGYIRVGLDGYDENWSVNAAGAVLDGSGQPTASALIVPEDFQIMSDSAAYSDDQATQWMTTNAAERRDGLSATVEGENPSEEAWAAFRSNISKTRAVDAADGDLTWAGDAPGTTSELHGRALGREYKDENERATAGFEAESLRGKQDPNNTQWTTIYDPSETDSVRAASISEGKLIDSSGTPLNGKYGYVVDPGDRRFYTFDGSEGYVSKGGEWLSVSGLTKEQLIGVLEQALADGEQVSFVHHSTAVAGGPVAGAGMVTVVNGQITEIDDKSGHYKPEGEYLWQTISWLRANGMPVAKINVTMIAKGEEAQLILKGWQMEQTHGNQAQARLKAEVNREILDNAVVQQPAQQQEAHSEDASGYA